MKDIVDYFSKEDKLKRMYQKVDSAIVITL